MSLVIFRDHVTTTKINPHENILFSCYFYVPATKWPGHIVLPMSVIPK
jgi:hypothetical protein